MAITSIGVGSGLPVDSIIEKMMAVEQVPINQLQTRTDAIKTQISAYGKIQSAVSALRDASSKLTNPSTWAALTATMSDASMASVVAGTGSGAGTYTMNVSRLAAAQSVASSSFSSTPAVGAGTLTIELGAWNDAGTDPKADPTTFTSKDGKTPVSVSIDADDTLADVRDKINGANAGVLASVVTDASGSRLVIRSKETGAENGFRITTADSDGTNGDASGLSRLAYDPTAGVKTMSRNAMAQNAALTINGLDISSATNNIEGAIDGLSVNLLKTGESTITVGQNKDSVKKVVTDFVASYNSLMSMLRDNTKYDAATKAAGALQGDSTAVGLQAQLRNVTAGGTTLGGAFARLADVGLDIGSNGTITVNDTKLTSALGQMSDVKNLFMGIDTADSSNNGLAQRLRTLSDQMLSVDGSITTRTNGLQSRVTANTKRTDEMNDRAAAYEKRLRAQYTALDTQMAKLNDMQSYVSKITSMLGSS